MPDTAAKYYLPLAMRSEGYGPLLSIFGQLFG
jgi:hypothetical protein